MFNKIIGLSETKHQLIKAIQSQHIAHAQLFGGKEGSANLALALAYAQYLHCEDRQIEDSCGKCASCKKYEKFIHPDLHFVFPVATTKKITSKPLSQDFLSDWRKKVLEHPYFNLSDWLQTIEAENKQGNISVEESRNVIQSLSLKAFEGEFKILLLWLPEMMNTQAANALLKILEEPPPKTIFLMVCNDTKSLLATIISRVQMSRIPAFTDQEIEENLVEKFDVDSKKAIEITYLADGNLNEAIRLTKEDTNDNHTWFRDWMRACYKKDIADLVKRTDEFAALGKEGQKNLLLYGLGVCRETLVLQNAGKELLRLSGEKLNFIEGFAKTMSFEKLEYLYAHLNEAYYHLERNANVKILFLDVSLGFVKLMR